MRTSGVRFYGLLGESEGPGATAGPREEPC
jgi:hypothetical protein